MSVFLPTIAQTRFSWRNQVAWANDKHLLPEFDFTLLEDMTRPVLQKFFNRKATELGPTSVSHIRRILHQILALAEQDALIAKNPVPSVRTLPPDPKPPHTFTPAEVKTLYDNSHDLIKPFVFLTGLCGLRQGEALGMKWSNVTSEGVRVVEQLQAQGKELVTLSPKTKAGNRIVPLPPEMLAELLSLKRGIYVCTDTIGGPLRPKNVRRELNAAQERAGLPSTGPHALRHSFITGLRAELEAPDHIVKDLVGHSRKDVIDRYTRTAKGRLLHWMDVWWGTLVHGSDDAVLSSKLAK